MDRQSARFSVRPRGVKTYEKWEWPTLWSPPTNAPPERLVAFHPDYEIGIVELPLLGPGQIRRGVDIVLYQGSRVSGRVVDDASEPVKGARIEVKVLREGNPVLIQNDNRFIEYEKIILVEIRR